MIIFKYNGVQSILSSDFVYILMRLYNIESIHNKLDEILLTNPKYIHLSFFFIIVQFMFKIKIYHLKL